LKRTAKCACERVSVVVDGDPAQVMACHCDFCQRSTGTVYRVACWYPHSRVLELNGETKRFSESPNSIGVDVNFCPNCGSTVHWTFDRVVERPEFAAYAKLGEYRAISVGCFADKDFPMPRVIHQTQYRHHWLPPLDGVPSFESFAPPEAFFDGT